MAPQKRGSVALSAVQPTDAELAEARATISGASDPQKKLRSQMATFTHWLKSQGASENMEALESTGEARTKYLEEYLVWQRREKRSKCETTVAKVSGSSKHEKTRQGWMSYHAIEQIVGKAKLDMWIDRSLLSDRVDPRSGSDEKEFKEYWYSDSIEELDKYKDTSAAQNIKPPDQETADAMVDSLEVSGPSSSSTEPPPQGITEAEVPACAPNPSPHQPGSESLVKKEQEASHYDKMIAALNLTKEEQLTKFQLMVTESKVIHSKCAGQEYQEKYTVDVDKHVKALTKTVKMLEAVVVGEGFDPAKLKALVKSIETQLQRHKAIVEHGSKFGYARDGAGKAATRRKRTKASGQ